ncbi:MAG: hypothetical protein ACRYGR_05730 [Janthinobacterium lividum]
MIRTSLSKLSSKIADLQIKQLSSQRTSTFVNESQKRLLSSKAPQLLLMTTVSALALFIVLAHDSLATEVAMTAQLDKVTTLASGGIAKTGLIVGTICSAVIGLFKNSWMVFISSIGIGVGLTYYLEYLKSWGG